MVRISPKMPVIRKVASQEHVPDLAVGGEPDALGLVEDEADGVDQEEPDGDRADLVVGEEGDAAGVGGHADARSQRMRPAEPEPPEVGVVVEVVADASAAARTSARGRAVIGACR